MAYTKNTWQSGDTITSEKLNHIEQGVYDVSQGGGGGGVGKFIVTLSQEDDTWTADKDVEDIVAAYNDGQVVCAIVPQMAGGVEMIFEAQCIVANSVQTEDAQINAVVFSYIVELEHGTCACKTVSGFSAQEGLEKEVNWEVSTTELSGGAVFVEFSQDMSAKIECDTSISEIKQAVGEGKAVFGKFYNNIYTLNSIANDSAVFEYADSFQAVPDVCFMKGLIDDGTDTWEKVKFPIEKSVTVTYTITDNQGVVSATCDKEYKDINAFISDGKAIIFRVTGTLTAQTSVYILGEDTIVITIPVIDGEGGSPVAYGIVHASNDTITPVTPS